MKNTYLATILSFFFPGLGQLYNGEIGKGFVLIIGAVLGIFLMAIVVGFFWFFLLWVYGMYDAYNTAREINAFKKNSTKILNPIMEGTLIKDETELFRIKGERKGVALLEYYRIIVTDKRIVIGRTSRGHTKLTALSQKTGKYDRMTPEEVLNNDRNNFAIRHDDVICKGQLVGGAIIIPNNDRKMIKISMLPGDFKKIKSFLEKKSEKTVQRSTSSQTFIQPQLETNQIASVNPKEIIDDMKTTIYSDEDMLSEDLFETVNYTTIPWFGGNYTGQVRDGKPDGQGKIIIPEKAEYAGEWKDGKPDGFGNMKYAGGATYVGEFASGTRHGQGTYTYSDGRELKGEWENGKYKK